ncbi:MAG: HPP family protein [Brevundimonas sp.]|nr:MAG: HPP family protein [Brevundimonas sp.]
MAVFRPILAGATLRDRVIACIGALIGIGVTGLATRALLPGQALPALILTSSMGASAVLLFAVPASPLAQPWPIIGGNTVSALAGLVAVHLVKDPMLAGAVAIGLAIAAMSMGRCLHPPGGGTALIPVLGGPAIAAAGWLLPFVPVALNAVLLVAAGWLFHRVSGHAYPHRPTPVAPPAPGPTVTDADIEAALADFGEPLDISRDDLRTLAQSAATHAARRA